MKNLPLILGIVVIVLLAIFGYWYMNKTPSSQTIGNDTTVEVQEPAGGSGMMSMKELLASGKDQTCTFSHSNENGSVTGSSYISGGKMRTDFDGTYADGKAYAGGMINDGSYLYSWTTDTDQGFKMAMTDSMNQAVEDAKEDAANNPNTYVNQDEKLDYKCSTWQADTGMFVPPANITFTDYSQTMKQILDTTNANPDMKTQQCAACDSLPEGETKTMCKKSLACE